MAVIIGLDPGSRLSGIGILRVDQDRVEHLHHGVIDARTESSFHKRILKMGIQFKRLLGEVRPDFVVIEELFLGKNADSVFKLGHARGVFMYEALEHGAIVCEYATRAVKKAVTGSGAADKIQVHLALEKLLKIRIQGAIDASDALALAYHHAIQLEIERKMTRLSGAVRGLGV